MIQSFMLCYPSAGPLNDEFEEGDESTGGPIDEEERLGQEEASGDIASLKEELWSDEDESDQLFKNGVSLLSVCMACIF